MGLDPAGRWGQGRTIQYRIHLPIASQRKIGRDPTGKDLRSWVDYSVDGVWTRMLD